MEEEIGFLRSASGLLRPRAGSVGVPSIMRKGGQEERMKGGSDQVKSPSLAHCSVGHPSRGPVSAAGSGMARAFRGFTSGIFGWGWSVKVESGGQPNSFERAEPDRTPLSMFESAYPEASWVENEAYENHRSVSHVGGFLDRQEGSYNEDVTRRELQGGRRSAGQRNMEAARRVPERAGRPPIAPQKKEEEAIRFTVKPQMVRPRVMSLRDRALSTSVGSESGCGRG